MKISTTKLQLMLHCVNLGLHWHVKKSSTTKASHSWHNFYLSLHSVQTFVHDLINTEVSEEPVSRTKKIPQRSVKFGAGEENRIVHESL